MNALWGMPGVLVLVLCLLPGPARAQPAIGWVDTAAIYPGRILVRARMDSGAKTSSLRTDSCQSFERGGDTWIRLRVTDRRGHPHTLERRVVRIAAIKQHSATPTRRPVIRLGLCVGDVYKEVEVTVAARANLNYPLLVGRNFLAGSFLIDSARTYTAKPACSRKGVGDQ